MSLSFFLFIFIFLLTTQNVLPCFFGNSNRPRLVLVLPFYLLLFRVLTVESCCYFDVQRTLEVLVIFVSATQLFCAGAIHARVSEAATSLNIYGSGRVWSRSYRVWPKLLEQARFQKRRLVPTFCSTIFFFPISCIILKGLAIWRSVWSDLMYSVCVVWMFIMTDKERNLWF